MELYVMLSSTLASKRMFTNIFFDYVIMFVKKCSQKGELNTLYNLIVTQQKTVFRHTVYNK